MFSLDLLLKLLMPKRERAEKKLLLFLIVCEKGDLVFK